MNRTKTSTDDENTKPVKTGPTSTTGLEWITETINGGTFRHVDLNTGTNGWALPPGNVFSLRSQNYFTTKQKSPGGDYLLSPAGVDWLKSTTKRLDHVLSRPDNRITHALKASQSRSFIFAVNFQIPSKEHYYSLVLYFAAQEPIRSDSILHKLVNGDDDSFRDERFKIVSNVVKGPWVVKSAAGKFGAFVVGKSGKSCSYHRGPNYFEIDVDISSSAILTALFGFMLGYVTSLTVDIGFVVEAQVKEELPERLIGGVSICHMELSSAFLVDDDDDDDEKKSLQQRRRLMGAAEGDDYSEDEL